MAANKSFQESPTLSENAWNWDEIALRILKDSHIDLNDYWRYPLSGRKKHRLKSLKKPRAIPQVILKLQEPRIRESALHLLSSFLFEKREEDPENYYRTGLLLYDSCCTMTILIQELLSVYGMIIKHNLTERSSMRLINILIIFQCIAANCKTRLKLVNSDIPSLLIPIITYWCSLKVYGNVQAVALSVFAILCQARETYVINWALKSSVMEVSILCIHSGNELTKVVGLHIVESILQHRFGIERIYNQFDNRLLMKLLKTLENLVDMMGINKQCYYPRLLFHVLRCYTLLCDHIRGVKVVKMMLPNHLRNRVFRDTLKEYPLICRLHHWLLLILGENTVSLSLHGCA